MLTPKSPENANVNGYVEMTYILLFLMHFLLQAGEEQIAGRKIHLGLDTQTNSKQKCVGIKKWWSQIKDIFTQ